MKIQSILYNTRYLTLSLILSAGLLMSLSPGNQRRSYYSPVDMALDTDMGHIYVAGFDSRQITRIDQKDGKVLAEVDLHARPKAIAVAGNTVFVVCSDPEGELIMFSKRKLKELGRIPIGHGSSDVVVSKDGKRAYITNQFSDDVSVVDLEKMSEIERIRVRRQPKVLELSADGRHLFVANFLPAGRADQEIVSSEVSVINIEAGKVVRNIELANGSNALRGISLSKDGNYIFVSHNLGRFLVPTTQLEQGWMNTSALSVIDASTFELVATVLLDEPERGAAGSWGIDCTPEHILVAHSGTHDFSIIDYGAFMDKLLRTQNREELSYDLRFLSGIRTRYPVSGNGPRTIVTDGSEVFLANYFSDRVDRFDLEGYSLNEKQQILLNHDLRMDSVRLGEMYFNDALYCFQQWQSCNGCHPDHARTDGLNWDLLNDGIGNPKNCKSMLYAHATPPAMISGIRPNAEFAVRAGFRHIQFARVEESKARAVDKYLASLRPVASPMLQNGKLSPLARKGEAIFRDLQCQECHPAPLYSDRKIHKIGSRGDYDRQSSWDTPTLLEVWRTGPYLHDGKCASMEEVFSVEKHGIWKDISNDEVQALTAYVLSL